MANIIVLEQTCEFCPEQYWAYKGSHIIGYIRLRWGHFTCDYLPNGRLTGDNIRVLDKVFNDQYKVDNLEWCTDKYNHNYGTYIERQRNFQPRNTPVLMFDLNGNFEKEFISAREAAREMNTSHALICHCCEGYGDKQNRVSLKCKLWCYKGEEDSIPSKVEFVRNYKYRTKVVVYFPDGTSKEYESATKAGKEINVCRNKLNKDGYDEKSGLRWTVS